MEGKNYTLSCGSYFSSTISRLIKSANVLASYAACRKHAYHILVEKVCKRHRYQGNITKDRIWRCALHSTSTSWNFCEYGDEPLISWKLRNYQLHSVFCAMEFFGPNIIQVIKSRIIIWVQHAAHMVEKRGAYKVLVGKPEGKRPLGRPRHRWENNSKKNLQ